MQLSQFTKAKTQGDAALKALFLAALFANTPLINYLNFYSMTGNADTQRKNSGKTGTGSKRTLNNDFAEPKVGAVAYGSSNIEIHGDKLVLDYAYEDRGGDILSERRRQLEAFAPNFGQYLANQVFNGTGADGDIYGIKALVPAGRCVKFGGDNGGEVLVGKSDTAIESQDMFLSAITGRMEAVIGGPDIMCMNGTGLSTLWSIAKHRMSIANIVDAVGNTHSVKFFDNVPIINPGYTNDNSGLILPNTETCGTSTDCSSIYFLKFGEKENLTAMTNVGMKVHDMGIVGVHYTTQVEIEMNQMLLDERAVARLEGVRFPNFS